MEQRCTWVLAQKWIPPHVKQGIKPMSATHRFVHFPPLNAAEDMITNLSYLPADIAIDSDCLSRLQTPLPSAGRRFSRIETILFTMHCKTAPLWQLGRAGLFQRTKRILLESSWTFSISTSRPFSDKYLSTAPSLPRKMLY